jgi:hypothetical protein
MVKIRYTELPAGLHVDAKRSHGDTIVYLLPGLTPEERRVALNRVRSSGLLGQGPSPSTASILIADSVDRVRTVFGNGAAAVRGHPVLLLPSLLVMAGTFFALVSLATLTVHQPGGTPSQAGLSTNRVGTGGAHPAPYARHYGGKHARPPGRHESGRVRGPDRRRAPRHAASMPSAGSAGDCVIYGVFGVCEPQ